MESAALPKYTVLKEFIKQYLILDNSFSTIHFTATYFIGIILREKYVLVGRSNLESAVTINFVKLESSTTFIGCSLKEINSVTEFN